MDYGQMPINCDGEHGQRKLKKKKRKKERKKERDIPPELPHGWSRKNDDHNFLFHW
jgi:hypothetical protein